jgi:hypothetical protein
MDDNPMSYLLFKLNKEMNYQDTFENNEKVKKEYKTYLQGYRKEQKKRRGISTPPPSSLKAKL